MIQNWDCIKMLAIKSTLNILLSCFCLQPYFDDIKGFLNKNGGHRQSLVVDFFWVPLFEGGWMTPEKSSTFFYQKFVQ